MTCGSVSVISGVIRTSRCIEKRFCVGMGRAMRQPCSGQRWSVWVPVVGSLGSVGGVSGVRVGGGGGGCKIPKHKKLHLRTCCFEMWT